PTPPIYTLSLHDARPISPERLGERVLVGEVGQPGVPVGQDPVQNPGSHAADHDRRMRPLGRLGPGPDALESDVLPGVRGLGPRPDRKSTRLNSSHVASSY